MGGYKSALVYFVKDVKQRVFEAESDGDGNISIDQWLNDYIKSYKKAVARKKDGGVMCAKEGKSHITMQAYAMLNLALVKGKMQGPRSFLFSTLQWNLLSRSVNIDALWLHHLAWENECITVKFVKMKKDAEGDSMSTDLERHVFANPHDAHLCPLTALGIFLMCNKVDDEGTNHKLFNGTEQKHRYAKDMRKVILDLTEEQLKQLGIDLKDLGTHSWRKGAATYLLGVIDGPSPVAVYIRMGWSLGNTQDRYIAGGTGSDQHCGRMACGLQSNSSAFAALPPHFHADAKAHIEAAGGWTIAFPDYNRYPSSLQRVCPFVLASVLHHYDTLGKWFDPSHCIWMGPLFAKNMALVEKLRRLVVNTDSGRCAECGMTASGVPAHIYMQSKVERMEAAAEAQAVAYATSTEKMISSVKSIADTLPEQLKASLLQNFKVKGAVPVTSRDFATLSTTMTGTITSELKKMREDMQAQQQNIGLDRAAAVRAQGTGCSPATAWVCSRPTFDWGGQLRILPASYNFPVVDPQALWILWFFGEEVANVPPVRFIRSRIEDLDVTQPKKYWKAALFMDTLLGIAKNRQEPDVLAVTLRVTLLSMQDSIEFFRAAYKALIKKLYHGRVPPRHMSLLYTTLVNHITTKK
jgi:hypothetical protein